MRKEKAKQEETDEESSKLSNACLFTLFYLISKILVIGKSNGVLLLIAFQCCYRPKVPYSFLTARNASRFFGSLRSSSISFHFLSSNLFEGIRTF